MITIRPAGPRGRTSLDWLESYHTFSFGDYYDPRHMGFRALRVLNEDRVQPGAGFGTHPHRDMEIITCVLEGALEHADSMKNGSIIRPGELQRMSAGTGVTHSERNPSPVEPAHFLQIWIVPERKGLEPSYEQRRFPLEEKRGELVLVASRDGREGSLTVHQDVSIYASRLECGDTAAHPLSPGRHAWLQVAEGKVALNGAELEAGGGAAISSEAILEISAREDSQILVFDLS